jgi:hypothetical protein
LSQPEVAGREMQGHRDEVGEQGYEARLLPVQQEIADQQVIERERPHVQPEDPGFHRILSGPITRAFSRHLRRTLKPIEACESREGREIDHGVSSALMPRSSENVAW